MITFIKDFVATFGFIPKLLAGFWVFNWLLDNSEAFCLVVGIPVLIGGALHMGYFTWQVLKGAVQHYGE